MALGTIQINRLDLFQGELSDVEMHFLFIGQGGTNVGSVLSVTQEADLDDDLGEGDSVLKTQVQAAMDNADQNWSASVMPIAAETDWQDAVDYAMGVTSCEAIVLTDAVTESTAIEAMQAKADSIMSTYMRPVFILTAVAGCDAETQTWATYCAAVKEIIDGISADSVAVVPYLWGFDLGTLAGRLCNSSVTVADTPMRVATGALSGSWSDKPVDSAGAEISMAYLKTLDGYRFSVPQWYPDYDGMYWGDCNMLASDGSDYEVVEYVRVMNKAVRQVKPYVIARIGDRRLNSTAVSIAENKTYFMKPLRAMAKSVTIGGYTFPGEIYPPTADSIVIEWKSKTSVLIYITVQPYNCPKSITVNLALDLSTE